MEKRSFNWKFLYWEAAFALAYETWVGASYLSGLAGEMHVPVVWVSLLLALPWIGSLGQLMSIAIIQRIHDIRGWTLRLAATARALWAVPLLAGAGMGLWYHSQGVPAAELPVLGWFQILVSSATLSALLGAMGTVCWLSWMRRLVPAERQGRFLGNRQAYVMLAMVGANLVASALVGWKPDGYYAGYASLWALGLIAAAISTYLLAKAPLSISTEEVVAPNGYTKIIEEIKIIWAHREARSTILFFGAFNASLSLAGPFFPYYFTKELQIPMSTVALWLTLTNLGAFATAPFWGRLIDSRSRLYPLLLVCAHLMAVSPLLYLSPSADVIRWIGPFEYALNGMAFCGYQLAMMALLFRTSPLPSTGVYFSLFTGIQGIMGAGATFVGGHLAEALAPAGMPGDGFRRLWLLGAVARLAVVWAFWYYLRRRPPVSVVSSAVKV